jgi:hypothetical protein
MMRAREKKISRAEGRVQNTCAIRNGSVQALREPRGDIPLSKEHAVST